MNEEVEAAWEALGVTREEREANDDSDCETLAQCVAIALQYERDRADDFKEALARMTAERDKLLALKRSTDEVCLLGANRIEELIRERDEALEALREWQVL